MKDSGTDWNNMKTTCESLPGFRVYAGSEEFLLPIMRAGGAGCISATVNVTGRLTANVYAKRAAPDADSLQQHLSNIRKTIAKYPLIPALKRMTAERTGQDAWRLPRPPHLPFEDAPYAALKTELRHIEAPEETAA